MIPKLEKKKRAKPFAANLESTKKLQSEGWIVWTVEQTIPHTFIKRDCFGFADLLAMSPSRGIMLVQATGGSNFSTRLKKIKSIAAAGIWLASSGRIQLHSWEGSGKERSFRMLEIEIEQEI